nr:MAG TPA: nucleoid-associated protein [Caudoviricetes sp.]
MSRWNIYHNDGTKLTDVNDDEVVVHGLQYSDKWMGDCFLTIDFKNNAPINFKIGDYIIYRGDRFELNYEPGKDKKSSLNTYGEGFVYDSVKFNALQDELSRSEFYDVVLNDNELHYTTLPKFPFYVQTLDDLLDRIQANLNEQIGVGLWKIYSRNMERSVQRGALKSEWMSVYGEGTSDNVIEPKSITVDGKTCWEALALVNSEWDVNFIVRGRNVYVGTAGVLANNIFKYGLGKGLSELIQNADSEQQIVTRLRAYGSEKNLPSHYYADLGTKYFCNITEVNTATSYLSVYIDMEYIDNYFTIPRVFVPNDGTGKEQTYGYVLKVTFDFQTVITCVVTALSSGQAVMLYSEVKNNMEDNGDEPSKENLDRFIAQVNAGNRKIYIVDGLNKKAVPSSMKKYAKNLPNNMSINRLMLPGFPHVSLNDYYNSLSKADKEYVNPTGKEHVFSTNPYRPYIDSVNIQQIGLRSASQYFDNDDKTNGIVEIYPTIEEMVVGGVRVDEIDEGVAPNDNGRFEDGQTVNNVDIYLNPSIDFDINDLKDSDFSIAMKDGMCGGRTFKVASSVKENGRWRLTIQRVKDDALELWFPYKDYPIRKGDHFVLTGIILPDSYVNAASLKLLKYAIAYIDKNDYTRYVYQPKVDEVFMARQNDQATEDKTGTIKSLHDTLKAGDIMEFDDDDLHIGGKVTIDQLVIRENEGGIPTYEVTLRNNVEVGTMAKIKQQISSLESGNGKVSSETSKQITDSTINEASKHFLSKLKDDTAQGVITFIKGLVSEALVKLNGGAYFGKGGALIDDAGRAILESLQSIDYDNAAEQGFSVEREKNGKYHAFVTNLTIWGKAIFNELEVRKLSYAGGNVYLSGAGSKIVKVVPVTWESESSEWIETSVDKYEGWLCYLLADDGTMATQNLWREGDQVRCRTIGTLATGTMNASNKSYWRTIPAYGVSSVNEKIYDGYGNELYGGQMFSWIVIGKHSLSLDSMTEEFATAEIGGIPEAGDTIVLDGHRAVFVGGQIVDDDSRKGVLILESTGENTPRIVGFKGVDRYTHKGKEVFVLSPDRIRLNSGIFEWVSSTGDAMHMVNYRGEWKEGSYAYYDQVNHNNALWTCINENGTRQEPSDASSDWQKVLSGEKGEKGDKGDRGDEGPQGPKGETGAQGPQGEKGEQGKPGADGTNGEDGVSILIVQPIVLDTNDNGIVSDTTAEGRVMVMRGGENVTNECSDVKVSYMQNCTAAASLATGYIKVKLNSVNTTTLASGDKVSVSEGYVTVAFSLGGKSYATQVPFSVNVTKYMGSVKATAKQYQSKFEALENDLKGSNPTVLKAYTSTIKQTAKEITLSVTQNQQGQHNLLRDTALTRKGDIYYSDGLFQPTITQGVNGHNAIRFSVTGNGTPQYKGLFWGQTINGIAVKKNTDYTFSAWIKCDTKDLQVHSEVFKMAALNSGKGDRITATSGKMDWLTKENEVNRWRQVNYTFNTGNAEFIEVNIFVYNGITVDGTFGYTASGNGWICMPMLEEGSEYTGWTPAETDYDYVGGNLLEDTMSLTKSSDNSNLQFASGLILFGKYEGCYGILYNKNNSAESQFTEALQYKFPTTATLSGQARIVKNQDYVFSFVAKGSGNINVYLYGDSVHANVYTETCEGNEYTDGRADGYTQLALTSTYKRYWVHWRIEDYTGEGAEVIPDKVLIRVPGDTEAWVTKPKLEEGAQLTDYTERKTDLIDRATAKAAGLEITSRGVTLYGEKIKVENTLSTGQTTTAALFKDGAINAALILAQMLTSQGHNGQMVRIADGLINIYGKAGTANIRFGLNSSGQAVLSYYDDNGNFLYDLGPAGIASLSKTDAKITSEQYIKAEDAGLTTPLGENVDLPWVDTTKSWYTATKDNNYILFVKGATGKKTTLYRYSAPRVNGKIVADSANGLSTYDLASAADGRTFTSRTMVKNGALTNLADGVFLTGDVTVYDNTKLVPSIKKGQSVTRPSFYVQTASFNAKFTTLGWFGRIYSIQTEITFGNLDVGIMSNNN